MMMTREEDIALIESARMTRMIEGHVIMSAQGRKWFQLLRLWGTNRHIQSIQYSIQSTDV